MGTIATPESVILGKESARGSARPRLDSIDLLRGVVMVIMALDHVRDYFSHSLYTDPPVDPTDLSRTTMALFLTRWVTHFCAPTFVFLAGTGAFLAGTRGKSKSELSWFLLTRGLWLVFLDLSLFRWEWTFNLDYFHEFGGVIWVIGWSMAILSALVFLPTSAVAVFGIGLIAYHNLLDGKTAAEVGLPEWLWMILHSPGQFTVLPSFQLGSFTIPEIQFITAYSLLPWLGVLTAGYSFGAMFLLDAETRRKQLLGLGLALTALFIVVRFTNGYGDSRPWSPQNDLPFTVLSFLNCQKYPPSVLYVLMTLGPAIAALALFEREWGAIGRFFVVFGRVPLFYYMLHIPLIHGLMVAVDYARYGFSPYSAEGPWSLTRDHLPPDYGVDLATVYGIWVGVVLLLFPLCWWFAEIKRRRRGGWLSYL
ncbi:MAG TPA: heparan-alpha-glucosaminide N-acetyltransferase domain-containing protein [Gemmataceae bacterium]|nr:heparan-alpha-glucosaminide N-acetyltransferase domain-containing protein [Gemmataceae bacterium]